MLLLSPAKINLGLQIIDKRLDGFHNLQTLFFPVPWSDIVEVLPSNSVRLHLTGLTIDAPAADNLCVKAFCLLQKDFNLSGAEIYLHKQIPFGAGLGGGSGNAAAVLIAANRQFSLALTQPQLVHYAAQLGSDCAFFIYNTPMLATGRGEILSPLEINLQAYHLLILKPAVNISTQEAYRAIKPQKPLRNLQDILQQNILTWKQDLKNDFEPSVFAQYPVLGAIKAELYEAGAVYAAMSGSGSALYGIFEEALPAFRSKFQMQDFKWMPLSNRLQK
jgi:4-diphosphocytidyl-2-C-methyl-D-erythritol kinase